MLNIGVLVSGRGSNLQALIDAIERKEIDVKIRVVISNKKEAYALERARRHNIPTYVVEVKNKGKNRCREEIDDEIDSILEKNEVALVVLAGYMRILSPNFVKKWYGRIINIHPSLLPSFPGVEAQKQAFDYGVKVTGCTVHFVDEGVDTGPIILQKVVEVKDEDTVESLTDRILNEEHKAICEAVSLIARGKLSIEGRKVRIKK